MDMEEHMKAGVEGLADAPTLRLKNIQEKTVLSIRMCVGLSPVQC